MTCGHTHTVRRLPVTHEWLVMVPGDALSHHTGGSSSGMALGDTTGIDGLSLSL